MDEPPSNQQAIRAEVCLAWPSCSRQYLMKEKTAVSNTAQTHVIHTYSFFFLVGSEKTALQSAGPSPPQAE